MLQADYIFIFFARLLDVITYWVRLPTSRAGNRFFENTESSRPFAIQTGVLAAGWLSFGRHRTELGCFDWCDFDWCDIVHAMGFRIISGTSIREFVENFESATAALDRARQLIEWGAPNIRILAEDGRVCSLAELEGLAEFENESDDA
jgi:hypothetical protein